MTRRPLIGATDLQKSLGLADDLLSALAPRSYNYNAHAYCNAPCTGLATQVFIVEHGTCAHTIAAEVATAVMTAEDTTNPSEETPLLSQTAADKHAALYHRFSPARKRVILALVSCAGIVPRKPPRFGGRHSARLMTRPVFSPGPWVVHPGYPANSGRHELIAVHHKV